MKDLTNNDYNAQESKLNNLVHLFSYQFNTRYNYVCFI